MTPEISATLAMLAEKIQSPSTPKGRTAYFQSLGGWSKAASKVAQSYGDKLKEAPQPKDDKATSQARLAVLLKDTSANLAEIAALSDRLK